MSNERKNWHNHWTDVATLWSQMGTCNRLQVGAVIYDPITNEQIGVGFNGAPHGRPHCFDVGCLMEDGHCVRTIHSEANAVLHALRHRPDLSGLSIVCTHQPCLRCTHLLAQVGIEDIEWINDYG